MGNLSRDVLREGWRQWTPESKGWIQDENDAGGSALERWLRDRFRVSLLGFQPRRKLGLSCTQKTSSTPFRILQDKLEGTRGKERFVEA